MSDKVYEKLYFGEPRTPTPSTHVVFDAAASAEELRRVETPENFNKLKVNPNRPLVAPDTECRLIIDKREVDLVFQEVYETKVCAWDFETTGFSPHTDRIVSLQIATRAGVGYYFPFFHENFNSNLPLEWVLPQLAFILEDPTILKIGQNLKFDYQFLCPHFDRWLRPKNVHDIYLFAYLLDEDRPYRMDLKTLTEVFLRIKTLRIEELGIKLPSRTGRWLRPEDMHFGKLPVSRALPYACPDVDMPIRLHDEFFWPDMAKPENKPLLDLYEKIEEPLIWILARMEYVGVAIDRDYLHGLKPHFRGEIERVEQRVQQLIAEVGFESKDSKGNPIEFNIGSDDQFIKLLQHMDLSTGKVTKKGRMQVSAKALEKLPPNLEVVRLRKELKEAQKVLGTYIENLSGEHVNDATGCVHGSFNQTVARTGRLSSSDPNLQNVPIRLGPIIRRAFKPRRGYKFIRADYSQIEVKIMAAMARCTALLEALASGVDIHAWIAIEAFHTKEPALKAVDPNLLANHSLKSYRKKAKAVTFGIIYGITKYGLADQLDCSQEEAQELIDMILARFPEIVEYTKKCAEAAFRRGYTLTLLKRRRHYHKENGMLRFGYERAAGNAPIQGSSGDMTKDAMVRIDEWLFGEGLEGVCFPVLTIHDELIYECREDYLEHCGPTVKALMEEALLPRWGVSLGIPVVADQDYEAAWSIECQKCPVCQTWTMEKLDQKAEPFCTVHAASLWPPKNECSPSVERGSAELEKSA